MKSNSYRECPINTGKIIRNFQQQHREKDSLYKWGKKKKGNGQVHNTELC